MKNRVIIIIITLLVATLFIVCWKLLIPFAKVIFTTMSPNETAEKYKQTWHSQDGKICFMASDKNQMIDPNMYYGTYSNNNEVVQIEIIIQDGYSEARITTEYNFEPLKFIYRGKGDYNILSEKYVVQVEKADAEFSDYKVGDVIVFSKDK